MTERRKNPRSALPQKVLVYNADDDTLLGTVADLSTDGLRITSDEPITEGTELDLRMLLPAGWSDIRELDFTAQCCWWEQEHADEDYNTGFHIVDITDTEAFVISEILDLYGNPVPG